MSLKGAVADACAAPARRAGRRRAPAGASARGWGCPAPRARPRRAVARRRAASHTDSMSTAIAPPACSSRAPLAQREPRDAHDRCPPRTFRPGAVQRGRERLAQRRSSTGSAGVPFVGGRHAPPRRRSLRPGTDCSSSPPQKPSTSSARPARSAQRAGRRAGAVRAHAGLVHGAAARAPSAISSASSRSGAAHEQLAHRQPGVPRPLPRHRRAEPALIRPPAPAPAVPGGRSRRLAARAAAWPLSTAPSSVAGQPVSVQAPGQHQAGHRRCGRRGAARRPRARRGTWRRARG